MLVRSLFLIDFSHDKFSLKNLDFIDHNKQVFFAILTVESASFVFHLIDVFFFLRTLL